MLVIVVLDMELVTAGGIVWMVLGWGGEARNGGDVSDGVWLRS